MRNVLISCINRKTKKIYMILAIDAEKGIEKYPKPICEMNSGI